MGFSPLLPPQRAGLVGEERHQDCINLSVITLGINRKAGRAGHGDCSHFWAGGNPAHPSLPITLLIVEARPCFLFLGGAGFPPT